MKFVSITLGYIPNMNELHRKFDIFPKVLVFIEYVRNAYTLQSRINTSLSALLAVVALGIVHI